MQQANHQPPDTQPPNAQPPGRTAFVAMVAGAIAAGRRTGLLSPPMLNRQSLMQDAAEALGTDDFGDRWFEQPFERLIEALHGEARLHAAGELIAAKQFQHVLHGRLMAQWWFKRHPEILERRIARPVVIVGPMRSGTTRLHRLLASDNRFSHLRSFETISPVPPPEFEAVLAGTARDRRPLLAKRIMRVARLANPRTLSIHPTGPYEPEEELGLLVASMWGMKHEAQWHVPSYARWCEATDAAPAYRHMADMLRLIGWSQQTSSLRPWILKTPQHMLDLPALLEVFPDARLIFTHRDPQSVVGSAASLAWNQTILYSDDVCPRRIGREWLGKTARMIEEMRAARDAISRDRMIDVQYEEMERNWRGTMERVYRFLGLDIAPALPAMQSYLERSKELKRHPHRYSLEQFGLSSGEVLDRLGDYVRTYEVPVEAAARPPRAARQA